MRTPKVGIDLDGVAANYVDKIIQRINRDRGTTFTAQDMKDFYFQSLGITRDEFFDYHKEVVAGEEFRSLDIIPGAREGIMRLYGNEVPICFITNRGTIPPDHTYDWFTTHNLPLENIFFTKDKALMCRRLGIEWMIDDYVKNIDDVVKVGVKGILYTQPYNESYKTDDKIVYRANNWNDVVDIIQHEFLHVPRGNK